MDIRGLTSDQKLLWKRYGLSERLQNPQSVSTLVLRSPFSAIQPIASTRTLDIREALKKPHILILGETGGGKSTLVKYLVANAGYPAIALDPHASRTSWQNMTVVGAGRKFKEISKEVLTLIELMNYRYELLFNGKEDFEPLFVIIDEFPAIVACNGKGFTDNIMLLVREARKVAIKLIILSIGSEVKSLGIEGQGSIRECFAMVRLSKFALTHAKSLGDEQIKLMLESAKYPAMLDDMPCELPIINNVQIQAIALPMDYLQISNRQPAIASSSAINVYSEPVDDSQEMFLIGILSGLSQQKGWLTASTVKQFSRQFKDVQPDQIREMFLYMTVKGIGQTQKLGSSLEWKL
jgi:Helicase HerA, central domain